jgi:hypothetical protein
MAKFITGTISHSERQFLVALKIKQEVLLHGMPDFCHHNGFSKTPFT